MELFTLGWTRGNAPESHFIGIRFLFSLCGNWTNKQEDLFYNASCLISSLNKATLINNSEKNIKLTTVKNAVLFNKMQKDSSWENQGGRGLIMGKVSMRSKNKTISNMVNYKNIIGSLVGSMANEPNQSSEEYLYELMDEYLDNTVTGTCEYISKLLKLPRKTDKMSGIFVNKNIGHGLFGFVKDGPPINIITLDSWKAFMIVQSNVPYILEKIKYQGSISTIEVKNKSGFYIDLDIGELITIN